MKVSFVYSLPFNEEYITLRNVTRVVLGKFFMSIFIDGFKKASVYSLKRVSKLEIDN